MMKRKRAHDEEFILKHNKTNQPLEEINNDEDNENRTKIFEVRIFNVENQSSK